ncbi:MAG TPA: precorrin-3B synthase [Candidatus Tectomicrobia bacterium]
MPTTPYMHAGEAATWVAVAQVTDLKPETACVVHAAGTELALIRTPEGFFALDNTCPHSGGPLGEGLVEGHTLTCPLHSWQFDCKTGTCLTEQKQPPQRRYAVKLEGGQVWVEVPAVMPPAAAEESRGAATAHTVAEGWRAVAQVADWRPGTVRQVQAGAATIALVCSTAGFHALDNACTHAGGPLGEGSLEGTTVRCPLHGWEFDARTGRCLTEPGRCQPTLETRVAQGQVWVRLAPSSMAPTPVDDPASKKSRVELWKAVKHGIDVWPDILRYAQEGTPMAAIDEADLERMKWYGYFYRKNNDNNHYMCRVRLPGCTMTANQARALAFIAYESGYSIVDVTTRGNVQVQGLTIEKLPGVRAALERVGLTSRQSGHDNIRNITSHPWSGIDAEELLDTRELARHIQAMIIGNREFADLPRKFNIALSGRAEAAAHAWTQDISYVAAPGPDGTVGFQLLLGGNQGQAPHLAWHIPVFVRPEQVLGVTAATLRTFRDLGHRHNRNQVRFRYLIERLGSDQTLLEIEQRLGYELERFPQAPPRPGREEDFIGWFKQKQADLWAVGVCVPVGRLTWDQLEGLAVMARQYGDGTLRTTYNQNLVLPGIPSSARQAVGYTLARYGLTFEPDALTRHMVACTGKQFCNLAVTETKGYAYQLIEALRRRNVQLHGINIHLSGCPSACAMSYTADIGLKGVKMRRRLRVVDAFDVYLGGGIAQDVQMGILYQKSVPFDQLPEFLDQVVHDFYMHRSDTETFSQYWRKKLQGHTAEPASQELPTWRCARCGHLHVASDPPPFCPLCAALRAQFEPAPTTPSETAERDALATPVPARRTRRADRAIQSAPPRTAAGPGLWLCPSCALQHTGEQPPELCPVCGVPGSDFRCPEQRTAAIQGDAPVSTRQPKPTGKRLLIVGGSIAGHTAAQTVRALDPAAQITLVTDEPHTFYNRLNLTRFLAEEVTRAALFDYTPAWYAEQQVEVLTETRVIALDPIKKLALLSAGRELPYDACILTHGSAAHTPPFYRADLPGVCLLRTLADVEGIIDQVRSGTRVAVIGGGVLGLEAAYGLVKRQAMVRVFERAPSLLPRQLDQAAAALFAAMVRDKGIEPHVHVGIQELLGSARVQGLQLADGQRFEADLVLVSTGIRPNIDWVKRSGIHCARGVLVDDCMQTSAEQVFAAGDVAEWRAQVTGLWTNAIEQAKVAAANAVGQTAFFRGCVPVTILKCLDIPLVSMGEICEDGDAISSRVQHNVALQTYRRVIFRHGLPVGGLLLGTTRGMGDLRQLIEGGLELERLRQQVVPDEAMAVGA